MTFCPECGKKIPDDSIYCPYCRTVVDKTRLKESKRGRKKSKYDNIYNESINSVKTEKKAKASKNASLIFNIILFAIAAIVHIKMPIFNIIESVVIMLICMIELFMHVKGKVFIFITLGVSVFFLMIYTSLGFRYGFFFRGNAEKARDLIVSDYGICIDPNSPSDDPVVQYYVAVSNPNDTLVAYKPRVRIRILDSKGNYLDTVSNSDVKYILPGDTVYFYGTEDIYTRESIHHVEADISLDMSLYLSEEFIYNPTMISDLEISDVTIDDENSKEIRGRLTNNSDYELVSPRVIVVYKKADQVVAINYTIIKDVAPDDFARFKYEFYGKLPKYDSVECYPSIY